MAKKSAISKGYRKPIEKKPYLSKRDITILCILLAVLAVAAILLFTYDDGALKVKDGVIVDRGENWLVVNGSTNGRRYYKLAELGAMDGYTLEPTVSEYDENIVTYTYTPVEEGPVTSITVSGVPAKPERAAEYYHSLFTGLDATDVTSGVDGSAFTVQSSPADENAEQTTGKFQKAWHSYFSAAHDSSIGIVIQASADTEEALNIDDQMSDLTFKTLHALTLEEK